MTVSAERMLRRFAFHKSTALIRQIFENAGRLKGVKREESLHAMRVATRRLRETWRLFDQFYPASRLKKQLDQVRKLTRTLGLPREMDVNFSLLSRLELLPDSSQELKLSREHLLEKLDQDRRHCRRRMKKKLKKIDLKSLQPGLSALAEIGLRNTGKASVPLENSPSPEQFLGGLLVQLSLPLSGMSTVEVDGLDDTQLHQLRIAAKKFRYALEITNPLFEDSFAPLILKTRELQYALGLNQDVRMLIQYLNQQVDLLKENGRTGLLEGAGQLLALLEGKKANQRVGISVLHSQFREILGANPVFPSAAMAQQPPPELTSLSSLQ